MIESWTDDYQISRGFSFIQNINSREDILKFINGELNHIIHKASVYEDRDILKVFKNRIQFPIIVETISSEEKNLFKSEYLGKLSEFGDYEKEVLSINTKPFKVTKYYSYFVMALYKIMTYLCEKLKNVGIDEDLQEEYYKVKQSEDFKDFVNDVSMVRHINKL